MKKIIIIILIFLFSAIVTGHAQLFRNDQMTNDRRTTTGIYDDSSGNAVDTNSERNNNSGGGLFRSDGTGPGGRPKLGDGIGEDSPIGGGANVLIACGIIFGAVKLLIDRRNK